MRRNEEGQLQVSVCNYLDYACRDVLYFHVPNQRDASVAARAYLKKLGTRSGIPDLMILWFDLYPRVAGIELKAEKGKQSDNQKAIQERFTKLGVPYALCRSLPEVEQALRSWGIKPEFAAPKYNNFERKQIQQHAYVQMMKDIANDTKNKS